MQARLLKRLFLGALLVLVASGQNCARNRAEIQTLSFQAPQDGDGWNGRYCPSQRLTWARTRHYPVTIRLAGDAPTEFIARFEVRADRDILSDYVIGRFTAYFDQGERDPTVITGVDGGANRIPQGAQELRQAFWLGCTNEAEIRGNGGQGPVGEADVYITLVESSSRVAVGGQTTSPAQPYQPIQCVRHPSCPEEPPPQPCTSIADCAGEQVCVQGVCQSVPDGPITR